MRKPGWFERHIRGAVEFAGTGGAILAAAHFLTGGMSTVATAAVWVGAAAAGALVSRTVVAPLVSKLGVLADKPLEIGGSLFDKLKEGGKSLMKVAAAAAVAGAAVLAAPALGVGAAVAGVVAGAASLWALSGENNPGKNYGAAAGTAVGAFAGVFVATAMKAGAALPHLTAALSGVVGPAVAAFAVPLAVGAAAMLAVTVAGAVIGGAASHLRDIGGRLLGHTSRINPPKPVRRAREVAGDEGPDRPDGHDGPDVPEMAHDPTHTAGNAPAPEYTLQPGEATARAARAEIDPGKFMKEFAARKAGEAGISEGAGRN